ncbi:DUF2891 domain-containing protein [Sediminibacterium soli]|uniref:DUF2891 domain-containing protein n=1 Tax=Sediminibacterium soli TaxID=2698829 RepID=UPI0013795BF2|nr:DUF2891 domain-containing protein [Sediminibacterium soli]NCI47835.1 DUF2891 domain-containing protein [Sediminibacterium soli]
MFRSGFLFVLLVAALPVFSQHKQLFSINHDSTVFSLTMEGASHLASLPLKCLQQEYPNKTGHTSLADSDHLMTPKQQHPAFYGCFDWHSCVHGHWMLVKLLKQFPNLPEAGLIRDAIGKNITPENIRGEIGYFGGKLSRNYERTYGWAWLLKLQQELLGWQDADAVVWRNTLKPLCDTIIKFWIEYLPKQTYPNRTGVHPNTAFGLAFALDYARAAHHLLFEREILKAARQLYLSDKAAPSRWEPDGTDFLSPSLEEADLMRRVLAPREFNTWFTNWISPEGLRHLTQLPIVSDRNDFQIVHLDGLCFSRSWCMQGIAAALPAKDKRKQLLRHSAIRHLNASLPHVATGNYGGEHWLASFAVYALAN